MHSMNIDVNDAPGLQPSPHTFHIPVMGTGFTIDTPLKVARYGISSVISLVDDVLIEQMRRYHSEREGEDFEAIPASADDCRARRITAYLDLMDRVVKRQVEELRATPFVPDSPITYYYELLPESPLKASYQKMLSTDDAAEREKLQDELRRRVVAGSIDANIMVKIDRRPIFRDRASTPEDGDALSALRGFARSTVRSSIVFSAGMNAPLYTYTGKFPDFLPDADGVLKKKIVLKVSDFRSAVTQSKFLARNGLWVSEYRIESGLNCGGHAFSAQGQLMGLVLEEFRQSRHELAALMLPLYAEALRERKLQAPSDPPPTRVTVQGGIGTFEEDRLLRERYQVDGTGWGTPFLLVPEVTNVDEEHLQKLLRATDEDVFLSEASPLHIPFWNLRESGSEIARRSRIEQGRPGSSCVKGYARLYNTEFTEVPVCEASREYQSAKLVALESDDLTDEQRAAAIESVLAKACLCHDLAGGATGTYGIDNEATTAVCSGPNIVNFSRIVKLAEMVGHIYGRASLLSGAQRPHMFIRELDLYVDYLDKEFDRCARGIEKRPGKYFAEFRENLLKGIGHYREVAEHIAGEQRQAFLSALQCFQDAIEGLLPEPAMAT